MLFDKSVSIFMLIYDFEYFDFGPS